MHKAPRLTLLLSCLALATTAARAETNGDDWHADVTVLTVSRSGVWGVGTATSISPAIALAAKNCRQRGGEKVSDCGGIQVTIRNSWALAYACGEVVFTATGTSLPLALDEAAREELEQRLAQRLPSCRLTVAVDPNGRTHAEIRSALAAMDQNSTNSRL